MKICDIVLDSRSFFFYINKSVPLDFLSEPMIKYLDLAFQGKHGERKSSPLLNTIFKDGITEEKMSDLGFILGMLFQDKWEYTFKMLTNDMTTNFGHTKTETINTDIIKDGETTNKSNVENTDSVSAYDEVEFSNNNQNVEVDSSTSTNKDLDTSTTTREVKEEKGIGSEVYNRLQGLSYVKNNILFDILMSDLITEVATLIF